MVADPVEPRGGGLRTGLVAVDALQCGGEGLGHEIERQIGAEAATPEMADDSRGVPVVEDAERVGVVAGRDEQVPVVAGWGSGRHHDRSMARASSVVTADGDDGRGVAFKCDVPGGRSSPSRVAADRVAEDQRVAVCIGQDEAVASPVGPFDAVVEDLAAERTGGDRVTAVEASARERRSRR